LTPDSFESVISANLQGSLNTIAALLPSMRERKDGLIINISSWAGRFAHLLTGTAYNAAKHGVVAMTLSLNMEECVNGIRACVICPGEVATPILKKRPIPPSAAEMARMLQAEDLGRTIRFVAEMPPHVCVNEIVISPTWNRLWLGGEDIPTRPCCRSVAHGGDQAVLAQPEHLSIEFLGDVVKCVELMARELGSGHHLDGQRVHLFTLDAHLVMEMGSSREAGRTDIADHLSLAHVAAGSDAAREATHVGVSGLIRCIMPKQHEVAVASLGAGLLDHAVT